MNVVIDDKVYHAINDTIKICYDREEFTLKATTKIQFKDYSEEAISKVLNESIGKPIMTGGPLDIYGNGYIGKITKAKRINESNVIEFEFEVDLDSMVEKVDVSKLRNKL